VESSVEMPSHQEGEAPSTSKKCRSQTESPITFGTKPSKTMNDQKKYTLIQTSCHHKHSSFRPRPIQTGKRKVVYDLDHDSISGSSNLTSYLIQQKMMVFSACLVFFPKGYIALKATYLGTIS
jgi:hypothetical protein